MVLPDCAGGERIPMTQKTHAINALLVPAMGAENCAAARGGTSAGTRVVRLVAQIVPKSVADVNATLLLRACQSTL